MLGVVVQIDAFDPLLARPVTLRAASHDDPAVCHVDGGDPWWPALIKLPTLRYDLFDGAFGGDITAPSSSLTLASEPWPNLGRYALADARIRLWTGDLGAGWATWTLRFDGRVSEQPELADGAATINFAVDDRWLDAALLTTYAGTTGAEGTEALKGQPKPLALGAPRYVAGTLIDNINTVFQLSAYGPLRGIETALERLARFGESVGDFASYAALVAANVPAGRWATAKAVGMVRLGAPPTGQVSFLIGGDQGGPNGWARLPGAIIRRLALLSGGAGRINDASLDALDGARPYNQSIYVDQQTTARQLIQQIAASVNAVAGMSWTGQLFVVPVGIGAPGLTLAADGSALPPVGSVKQIGIASPFQKLAIGAARAWTVHALSDIAFTATLVDLGTYAEGTTYREGNIVSLADGSRWLFINATAAAGHAPPVGTDGDDYWANLSAAIATSTAWPDVTDPDGTKPANNADVTGDNTSKDTNAVGGTPAAVLLKSLDDLEKMAIPAVNAAVADANTRITAAHDAADDALDRIRAEVLRAGGSEAQINERIDAISARGDYDDTTIYAEVRRVDTAAIDRDAAISRSVETVAASFGSDINAKAEEITNAYTAADRALSSKQTVIEASSRADVTMMNGNANFSNWPDTSSMPIGWGLPSSAAGATVTRSPGILGVYAMDCFCPAGGNLFAAVSGLDFGDPYGGIDAGMFGGPGWYVLEADVTLLGGSLTGSGVYCAAYNANGVTLQPLQYSFADTPANGTVAPGAGVEGQRYRFSILCQFTSPDTKSFRFHPMTAWTGYVSQPPPVRLRWHKAGLRAATESEIKSGKADAAIPALSARIKTTEDTLIDLPNRYATAQRTATIEAQLALQVPSALANYTGDLNNRVDQNKVDLTARIEERATAIADAKAGAVAQTVSDLRAEYNGTSATVSQQAGAIVNLQGKATAYVRLIADAGNGRAALSLWSDQYGGAWSLQGNGLIDGDLTLTGSLNTGKLAPNAVTASAALVAQNAQVNANAEVGSASATIITSSSSAVRIEYKCLASYYPSQGGTSGGCYGTVVRIANGVETAVLAVRFGSNTFTNDWAYDFPPEGQVTYVLRFRDYIASGSGGYYWSISQIQLGILGFKR